MKLCWSLLIVAVALPLLASASSINAESDLWEEDDKEVLVRMARGTKDRASGGGGGGGSPSCRYVKGQWSECDPRTNMRTRTLTLKKGDKSSCEQIKTITKKCKKGKACRYEKGAWTSCVSQNMTRIDNLKANSDPTCEKTRRITKRCKPETSNKKAQKDRSNKKAGKQQ
ncbi:uncharacterized protein LOC100121341 isoform X1 [Nasonia vitripennis]|uniref:Pleiotrophin/Midkine C-terminal domain-containing protein n=1 Tax=Nasonia vitripennis TaxID=7425 RepID=A0A7M7HCL0_NASVI|nr:uncharacterized protein LOC100121341 isoform X1 [Nasonia vitripennis]XP_031783618.1 uncharacterized protein LOC100121341 isoform X1 [Nasonia vitripennis]XP_032457093.1 uncharacterized protein LOC100121341 isoform X1 [Nasonia vitripennis]XP_032457097.1 uncharacterized protein LOC100121341 isoform X1 [Nasonia vitripennis]